MTRECANTLTTLVSYLDVDCDTRVCKLNVCSYEPSVRADCNINIPALEIDSSAQVSCEIAAQRKGELDHSTIDQCECGNTMCQEICRTHYFRHVCKEIRKLVTQANIVHYGK